MVVSASIAVAGCGCTLVACVSSSVLLGFRGAEV